MAEDFAAAEETFAAAEAALAAGEPLAALVALDELARRDCDGARLDFLISTALEGVPDVESARLHKALYRSEHSIVLAAIQLRQYDYAKGVLSLVGHAVAYPAGGGLALLRRWCTGSSWLDWWSSGDGPTMLAGLVERFGALEDELLRQRVFSAVAANLVPVLERWPNEDALLAMAAVVHGLAGDEARGEALYRQWQTARGEDPGRQQEVSLVTKLPSLQEPTIVRLAEYLAPADGRPWSNDPFRCSAETFVAPSLRLAVDLALQSRELDYCFQSSAATIPSPDPRRRGTGLLWRYEGAVATVVPPPPDPLVSELVYAVASGHFQLDEWWELTGTVARDIGAGERNSVLGTMVHFSPDLPYQRPAWRWIPAVQVAAALTLCHLDEQSVFVLLGDPVDWSTNAAIVAAVQLVRLDPSRRDEVVTSLWPLFEDLRSWGNACYRDWLGDAFELVLADDDPRRATVEAFYRDSKDEGTNETKQS